MILLILFFIGDDNTLYGMDKTVIIFPVEWDSLFPMPASGFRTSQGCLDLERWYQKYEAGFNTNIFRNIVFYYEFFEKRDYRVSTETHRFSLRFYGGNPYITIFVIPAFSKVEDEAGLGFGVERDNLWLETDAGIVEFDHNYYISRTNFSIEDPFTRFPISLVLKGLYNFRGYTKVYIRHVVSGIRRVVVNGVEIGKVESGETEFSMRNLFRIKKSLFTGFYCEAWRNFSVISDRAVSFYYPAENMEEYSVLCYLFARRDMGKDYIEAGPSYERHLFHSDTLDYSRSFFILNLFWNHRWNPLFSLNSGIQFSQRWINKSGIFDYNNELRLVLRFNLDFSEKTHFAIIEGIEIDDIRKVSEGINYLHNHTFVQMSHIF